MSWYAFAETTDNVLHAIQAILSQFDRKKLASKTSDDSDNDSKAVMEAARLLRDLDNEEPDEAPEPSDDDDEQGDKSREAADTALLDRLDDENPELVLMREEIGAGQLALGNVHSIVILSTRSDGFSVDT